MKVFKKILLILLVLSAVIIILSQVVIIFQSFRFIKSSAEIKHNSRRPDIAPVASSREGDSQ